VLVVNTTTVLTLDDFLLDESSVQFGELSHLGLSQFVCLVGIVHTLPHNLVDHGNSCLHFLLSCSCNHGVQRLILSGHGLASNSSNFPLLHRALATDDDLATSIFLHFLLCVSSGSNEQADEVDVWVLFLREKHFVMNTDWWRLVINWWFVFGNLFHCLLDEHVPLFFQLFAHSVLSRVQPLALTTVDWFGRWGPCSQICGDTKLPCSKLLRDFFNLKIEQIVLPLLLSEVGRKGCDSHLNLLLLSSPSTALSASFLDCTIIF